MLSGSINVVKKNTEDLVAASKRILEVNDEKTKSCLEIRMQDKITTSKRYIQKFHYEKYDQQMHIQMCKFIVL